MDIFAKRNRNISEIMRKVSSADTAPELLLRKALQVRKLQFQVNNTELPGKPDLVFPEARVAVFVDGDFWHGGQWRKRKLTALEEQFGGNKNKEYWLKKIRRNMDRDCKVTAELIAQGWTVLRFWERDIARRLEECVRIIISALEEEWWTGRLGYLPLSAVPGRTVAEFFTGMGFGRMGLEKEGWQVVFANEPDPQKRRIYESHFGKSERFSKDHVHPIAGKSFPGVTLASAFCSGKGRSGEGLDKGVSAFGEFIRLIRGMGDRKPPFVLLENRVGVLTSQGGNELKEALGALNNLGYQVDAFILDVVRFVPQRCKRLYVLGVLDSFGEGESLDPGRGWESESRPKPLVEFISRHPEIHWKLRDLPACSKRMIELEEILEEVPEDSGLWWSPERAGYLLSQMSPRRQAMAVRMMEHDNYRYGIIYRQNRFGESRVELRSDGMLKKIPASGKGEEILFKAGKGKYFVRPLTPRERVRLMGADDDRIMATENEALLDFGNEVSVPEIQWIARYYLNPLVAELLRGKPIRPVSLSPSKT